MEAACTGALLFAGADVEADCLTFVEEIPRKEVLQIEVQCITILQPVQLIVSYEPRPRILI